MIRLFLVEDETLIREGLRELLSLDEGLDLVGDAASGNEALERLPKIHCDLVLMDVRMPGLSGPETIAALRQVGFEKPVVLITTFDDDEALIAGMRAGARGYLRKDVTLDQLKQVIEEVLRGHTVLRPALTQTGIGRLKSLKPSFESSVLPDPLTPRETEVLRLIASGFANKEIADLLGNTEGTIKTHASTILSKLGVRDRTRAVLKALDMGII
jgi:DNA-binding NarL/FixJ family response regulator